MEDVNQISKTPSGKTQSKAPGPVFRWLRAVGFFRGFLIVSLIPVTAGSVAATHGSGRPLDWGLMFAALLGAWCYHAGANLLNDYYDHLSGADDINEVRTPFSGGTRVIQEGLLPARSLRNAAWMAYGLGSIIIWILASRIGPGIYWLAAAGAASGISYSLRPVWLAYRGLGEIVLGLNFGPILTAYGAYVQVGHVPISVLWIGTALGLWSAAIITVNEIPDFVADKASGKLNFVARHGRSAGVRLWATLLFAAVMVIVVGAGAGVIGRSGFFAAAFLPIIYLRSRAPESWTQDLDRVVAACRYTIIGHAVLWILLLLTFITAS